MAGLCYFSTNIRCILLTNSELNTAQIIEKACMHKELCVYFQHMISTQTLSHLTWWLCVHHRWRWCHCVVIGGGWWSKRICSRCSCLFCKWLKLSRQDNKHFWSFCAKIKVKHVQKNPNERLVPNYEILQVYQHNCFCISSCSVLITYFTDFLHFLLKT